MAILMSKKLKAILKDKLGLDSYIFSKSAKKIRTAGKFSKKQMENFLSELPSSFDVIGSKEKSVAILEIPEGLERIEKEIAESVMELQKNIKSVLKKVSKRKGKERIRELKLIAGEKKTEVLHKEYGFFLKIDPKLVYFSPREASERQRIASQVKKGEFVLVMFGGVGPFPIAIAKKQPEIKKIVSIEINKYGSKYAEENVRINKLADKILPIQGDVNEKCEEFFGKCDRVVMPLPLDAGSFLELAAKCLKEKGGIIHFYSYGERNEPFDIAKKIIKEKLKGHKFEIICNRIVSQYSPGKVKVCLDIMVRK